MATDTMNGVNCDVMGIQSRRRFLTLGLGVGIGAAVSNVIGEETSQKPEWEIIGDSKLTEQELLEIAGNINIELDADIFELEQDKNEIIDRMNTLITENPDMLPYKSDWEEFRRSNSCNWIQGIVAFTISVLSILASQLNEDIPLATAVTSWIVSFAWLELALGYPSTNQEKFVKSALELAKINEKLLELKAQRTSQVLVP